MECLDERVEEMEIEKEAMEFDKRATEKILEKATKNWRMLEPQYFRLNIRMVSILHESVVQLKNSKATKQHPLFLQYYQHYQQDPTRSWTP